MIKDAKLKAIDFFCGAGGVTCGFIEAGINVLGGIDNDITCKDTYEKNNHTKFLHADIRYLKKVSLQQEFGIKKNDKKLIFVGCSPCQYYTNLKTDKSKSTDGRMLLEDFQEFIEYYKPGYIFIENVPGFEKNGISPLSKFKKYLSGKNYEIADGVINARYFGVPQNRRRYVLIASPRGKKIKFPDRDKNPNLNVKNAIGNYEVFKQIEAGHKDDTYFVHSASKLSEINLKRIKKTPQNGGSRKAWAHDPELQLKCYKNHRGHWDVYGRMKWEEVSPAITTRFNSYSNGRYGHPEQDRAISLREGATLQTFPHSYIFYSNSQKMIAKMIGNAVPPKLSEKIGLYMKELVNGRK